MANRTSKIIIAKNIKIDKSYKNVLSYNESSMLNLVTTNQVASANNYSFIRDTGQISTGFSYQDCLKCNYMAFQNPDYDNKWFFAFIDSVEFKSPNNTRINYTVDSWHTWFSKLNFTDAFVIREHVSDDIVGRHTIPEGLETGEFICNSHIIDSNMDDIMSDLTYVMSTTVSLYDTDDSDKFIPVTGGLYNGIYSGTKYYRLTEAGINAKLEELASKGQIEAVNGLFMAPNSLTEVASDISPQIINSDTSQDYDISIASQTTIDGYIPKNKKLLTRDYNYLLVSNNNGSSNVFEYENFSTNPTFKVQMALTPGCSIRLLPTNYKGCSEGDEYGINMGKLPICSYNCDMYTNWMTQNSVNVGGATITSDDINMATSSTNAILSATSNIARGDIAGSVGSIVNGGANIANAMITSKQHSLIPTQTRGNLNCGDVITSSNKNNFHFYKMSIKREYAEILDNYFSAKGYKVNKLKHPNIHTRSNWNYIQIDNESNLGYGEIPSNFLSDINNIARNGVTIWHNHNTMLDYSQVNNNI